MENSSLLGCYSVWNIEYIATLGSIRVPAFSGSISPKSAIKDEGKTNLSNIGNYLPMDGSNIPEEMSLLQHDVGTPNLARTVFIGFCSN